MKKTTVYTLLALILLTISTALISDVSFLKIGALLILGLSCIKFLLVAFNFMELKKAHIFWKIALVSFLVLFILIINILTY
jgi:Flp pilus assembly protein protease CpaA